MLYLIYVQNKVYFKDEFVQKVMDLNTDKLRS